jgi:spermidine synthase
MRIRLLSLAAFASGAAALAYQLLWVRRLGEIFGQTAPAVAVVLAVFFLGLGLGAWWIGRVVSRPAAGAGTQGALRVYVALELAIGAFGLAFLPLCGGLERAYVALAPSEWPLARGLLVKGLLCAALLLPPAIAMGGTLPALVRAACPDRSSFGRRLAWICSLNTLGSALAALAVAFALLPSLGVRASLLCAVGANAFAALCAVLARRTAPASEERVESPELGAPAQAGLALRWRIAAALSGFVAIACEVLWTRALAARTTSTVYSFALVLAVYLGGLALGSLGLAALERRALVRPAAAGLTLACAGVAVVASMAVLVRMSSRLVASGADLDALLLGELGWTALAIGPAVACFGLALPLLARLATGTGAPPARALGVVWLANTCGTVLAALATGFWLLPELGLRASFALVSGLALLAGLGLTWSTRARSGAIAACIAGALVLVLLPTDLRLWSGDPRDRLVAYREGLEAGLAVVDEASGDRALRLNASYRLGSLRTRFAQERQGWIPLLLHRDARSLLFLGMGTGSSVGAVAAAGGRAIDVLEIVPELGELLPYFAAANRNLSTRFAQDPKLRLLAVDARHFVRTTAKRYDVVIGDLFVPWRAGEGAMFTREHFAAVRGVLEPGGLFCQWLPLYQLSPAELATIAATLCDVFPRVRAYWLFFNVQQPALGLVASDAPLAPDPEAMASLAGSNPRLAQVLEESGLASPELVLGSFVADERVLRRLLPGAEVESNARPRIEFDAPRAHFSGGAPAASANLQLLLRAQQDLASLDGMDALAPDFRERCARAQRAIAHYFRGALLAQGSPDAPGDSPGALREYVQALRERPGWDWILFNVAERCDHLTRSGTESELREALEVLRTPPPGTSWPRDFAAELATALGARARH